MTAVDTLYRWLGRDNSPAANEILAAGLQHAEPPYVLRLASMLLDRKHESAWAGLVANYDVLPPEIRQRVLRRPELVRAGVAEAAKQSTPRARLNALRLLCECPVAALSYVAANALLDPAPPVVETAAAALKAIATHALAEPEVTATNLVQAVRSALRTFERHGQAAVLEVSLWLATQVGDALWTALNDHRSRCPNLVASHLEAWNHPNLAGFLILALARPAWRNAAKSMLDRWQTRDEIAAILQQRHLLADPAIRAGLHQMPRPHWFVAAIPMLPELPPAARASMPLWVMHLGFTEQERLRCLDHWEASPYPELQRNAIYTLAKMDSKDATTAIARAALRRSPMARFARWFIAGQQSLATYGRRRATSASAAAVGHLHGGPR